MRTSPGRTEIPADGLESRPLPCVHCARGQEMLTQRSVSIVRTFGPSTSFTNSMISFLSIMRLFVKKNHAVFMHPAKRNTFPKYGSHRVFVYPYPFGNCFLCNPFKMV